MQWMSFMISLNIAVNQDLSRPKIEYILDDLYPDGMTETQINDLFWFEEEFLCESIGVNYDEYLER